MLAAGADLIGRVEQLGAMGFLEVLHTLPRHLRLLHRLSERARDRYDLAILIDYPGFHLRLGERLRQAGVPVVQFVAPQLWAWRPGRLARLRGAVDRLAVILPFEPAWFEPRGIACHFVGHPLMDEPLPDRSLAREAMGIPPAQLVLGIFPGSRRAEIDRNWPLFREVGRQLLERDRCQRVLVAGTVDGKYPGAAGFEVHREAARTVLAAATAALVKSGTTTLEAACIGTPMVVAYRASWSSQAIARRLMTVDSISLVNLILPLPVVPEFWHWPLRPARIVAALEPLLDPDSTLHRHQQDAFTRVRAALGSPGAASRVAEVALALLDGA
jgi:lipid-A-disaccharide synthase